VIHDCVICILDKLLVANGINCSELIQVDRDSRQHSRANTLKAKACSKAWVQVKPWNLASAASLSPVHTDCPQRGGSQNAKRGEIDSVRLLATKPLVRRPLAPAAPRAVPDSDSEVE
jgi:hypothetical protein